MFKKLSILQWCWFWFATSIVYLRTPSIYSSMDYNVSIEAEILGGYFWAGLVVVIATWIVKYLINKIILFSRNKKKQEISSKGKD